MTIRQLATKQRILHKEAVQAPCCTQKLHCGKLLLPKYPVYVQTVDEQLVLWTEVAQANKVEIAAFIQQVMEAASWAVTACKCHFLPKLPHYSGSHWT